ncbi:iron uptake system protein EfeO [Nocardioides jishulii]|uniref:Peptidase M75 family protein n=1 Tax=Nocardioides jishulii TaxID=2575440 RepID=A0A4U2YK22_9ACTN|nr:iron uptake system protein EfeO [Nocardioides jishulii]QCX26997.1 peptidase M75 family protein [Nocardioides jishulii]TKI61479.1 peptidase M75 family protein [Nocardioides jishulii]
MRLLHRAALPAVLTSSLLLAGCADKVDADDPRALTVSSSADACEVSKAEVPAGTVSFEVTNTGDAVTEFYVLAQDGLQILGEVENIGRDLSRTLTVQLPQGDYVTACKPGMKGDGIRADFTVSASDEKVEVSADEKKLVDTAVVNYRAYVQDQADQLLTRTEEFARLYTSGKDDEARALYPVARIHWERIEPVAESFGDLDPAMDLREADVEQGDEWTGWHRMEKDLWPARAEGYTPLTQAEREKYAADLVANTKKLDGLVDADDFTFTIDQVANGSTALLEEVAAGKVTGEEEYWSRTDLYDFQANLDGARVAFEGVRPVLDSKDPELAETLDARFTALEQLLAQYRDGDGFVGYDELDTQDVKQLKDGVDALSEPLSTLAAAVLA